MNSQIIAQSSRDRLLVNSQPRRAGLTRNHKGPSLLTQINGAPKSSTNIMASRGSTKQLPERNKLIVKEEEDEDINRPPDTDSSDTEDNVASANIKTTTFTRRGENNPDDRPLPKTSWEARRAASKAAAQDNLDKIRAKAARKNNAAKVTADKLAKGSCTTPASSQSSSSSKRKSQDEELESPRYGKDLVDEHGRLKSKKSKKTTTFSKIKPFKREPGFVRPDSDDDERPREFLDPKLTPQKPTKSASNKFIDPQLTPQKSSPLKQESKFFMPDIDSDSPSHSSNTDRDASLLSPSKNRIPSLGSTPIVRELLQATSLGLDNSVLKNARDVLATSEGRIPPPVVGEEMEDDMHLTMTQRARCPMCKAHVSSDELRAFGPMNIKKQERFCRSHRKREAEEEKELKGYPDIDWKNLDARISKHHSFIKKLINGEESHFRDRLSEKVNAGKERNLLTTTTNLTPGYYGARGLRVMSENIMRKFTPLLKKQMVQDRLMSSRGFTPYVQAVLVPEVAVLLIMEDMGVNIEEARDILDDSASFGELLNEEIREVVKKRVEDSEDSDD